MSSCIDGSRIAASRAPAKRWARWSWVRQIVRTPARRWTSSRPRWWNGSPVVDSIRWASAHLDPTLCPSSHSAARGRGLLLCHFLHAIPGSRTLSEPVPKWRLAVRPVRGRSTSRCWTCSSCSQSSTRWSARRKAQLEPFVHCPTTPCATAKRTHVLPRARLATPRRLSKRMKRN
jgi:hypothetical protein